MKEARKGRRFPGWLVLLTSAAAAVILFNHAKVPESVDVKAYMILLAAANLAFLAFSIDRSARSVSAWAAGPPSRPSRAWMLESIPPLLLLVYAGAQLIGTNRFYSGIYLYLSLTASAR